MKTKIIIAALLLLLSVYGAWYSFMFIAPLASLALIGALIIIIIYLPFNKFFNEKS